VQFHHRAADAGRPPGGLFLVAVQDADVVEAVVAAGAEERGTVGADRAVQPEPGDEEPGCGAQAGDVVAPGKGAVGTSKSRPSDEPRK
jgi:hypothetical protein